LTLEALLADETLFGASVIRNLVLDALSRLDPTGHRVMQALAVFGRPVREVAVHYLLSPYVEPTSVQNTLRRLTRGLYVNIKRSTGELILHPFYREFSYDQIPAGPEPYNRTALESRAATYYAQLRAPREKWKSIRDLDPQRAEFEHWLRAGEYDHAAEVLSSVDLDYLVWQGYARRVREMRLSLDGKIQDRRLQLHHHDSLGQVSMILGPHEDGIEQFKRMKAVAIELGDRTAEGKALGSLGETSRLLGRHDDAIAYLQEALSLFRSLDDRAEQEHSLFFLGLTYCYAGRPHEALECGEQLTLSAAEQPDASGTARAHNVLALGSLLLERWNDAVEHARESIQQYREVASLDGVCFVGNVEAMALFGDGRHAEGLQAFERTLTRAREDDLPRAEGLVLFNRARAFRVLQHFQAALESARAAFQLMTTCHFNTAAVRALIDALEAAAKGDRVGEISRLLDCARESLNNPDFQPPDDLVLEAETNARRLGLERLAGEAAQVARAIQSRREKPLIR
jgi:tetratricopeptide (TPR) repeat protein